MIDYADSLIKNIASHTSMLPSMNLLDKLNLLGSTLRQAHQSITSVLTTESKLAILNPTTIRASAQGRLDLTIVEARNLKNSTAQRTGLYCIIRYDSSTTKLKWHVPQSLYVVEIEWAVCVMHCTEVIFILSL